MVRIVALEAWLERRLKKTFRALHAR